MYFTKVVKKLSKSIKSNGPENRLFGQNGHFGAFLAIIVPKGREADFLNVNVTCFITRTYICLHILTKSQKN